jgi:hypothetical protein
MANEKAGREARLFLFGYGAAYCGFGGSSPGGGPAGQDEFVLGVDPATWFDVVDSGELTGSPDDLVEVEGDLRDQDAVGPSGHARVQGDPASMAAHHLADEDAMV